MAISNKLIFSNYIVSTSCRWDNRQNFLVNGFMSALVIYDQVYMGTVSYISLHTLYLLLRVSVSKLSLTPFFSIPRLAPKPKPRVYHCILVVVVVVCCCFVSVNVVVVWTLICCSSDCCCYCQAQLKLKLKLNWSWVALFLLYPATHPPAGIVDLQLQLTRCTYNWA